MADEKKYTVSISTIPASAADFVGVPNKALVLHVVVDETVAGDSRAYFDLKVTYGRVTKETAKPLFDALAPFLGIKKDLTAEQLKAEKVKVLAALSELEHTA